MPDEARLRRGDTDSPRRSREHALRLLFEADVRGVDATALLVREGDGADPDHGSDERGPGSVTGPPDEFTRALVTGVVGHRDELDARIAQFSRGWQVRRMPVVDRTLLRLATFELLHSSTPAAVVIDEAVELAKAWSTADSPRFVNGVLESIRRDLDGDGAPDG